MDSLLRMNNAITVDATPPSMAAGREDAGPLCVDCDGTLIHTDLLHESFLLLLRSHFLQALLVPFWLLAHGKAATKLRIARLVQPDAATLPYCAEVLDYLAAERARGRRIVLATASAQPLAEAVARHVACFDQVFATNETDRTNLAGEAKATRLACAFGAGRFEYLGNSRDDYPVWRAAGAISVANASPAVRRMAQTLGASGFVAQGRRPPWAGVLKVVRLHQWLKNLLLFVPVVAAHRVGNAATLADALLGFLAFGLCASSVYILNDMLDIPADRVHPRKKRRPFAAGSLALAPGALLMAALLCGAIGLAARLPPVFGATLATYYALTLAYSFRLKKQAVVDVMLLSMLYTIRILAGAAATSIVPSFWLLAFSMFLFFSLAIMKRYGEMLDGAANERQAPAGRGYRGADAAALLALGAASGLSAVQVLALYIHSEEVALMVRNPELLWVCVPLMLYWVSRVWIKTHRGEMHDDPVVFAAKDRQSLGIGLLMLVVMSGSEHFF